MSGLEKQPAQPAFVPIAVGILEVLKAAMWPMAAIVMFSSLYTPLDGLLRKMPEVIGRADVITIGDMKLQLTKALEIDATPEIRTALSSLSSAGASRIIRLANTFLTCEFDHDPEGFAVERSVDDTLAGHGLVRIEESPQDNNDERKKCYSVSVTELGEQTRSFLINFLASSLRLSGT